MAVWLRLDQFWDQTLIDDEWHAVHQIMFSSPSRFMLSFGFADYSIPLTLFYWLQAQWFGLSEFGMRLPMMLAGIATVALFPLAVRKQFDDRVTLMFAFLLATSPLLIVFSRMARPYALTILLTFCAYAFLARMVNKQTINAFGASGYVLASTLALWLHPITGPFLLAPLAALWWNGLLNGAFKKNNMISSRSLLALTVATGVTMAVAILPPLLADPAALSGKSGTDSVNLSTLIGVWYAWLGTGSTLVVLAALFFAALGAPLVYRRSQIVRWTLLGLAMTLIVIVITRPAWIFHSLTFARYLLPALPILLLFAAAGFFRLLCKVPQPFALLIVAAALAAASIASPLREQLRFPNSNTLHLATQMDFRYSENPVRNHIEKFPLSPFWTSLAAAPAGSITVAVAPFRFESFNWPAPAWETTSRQRVMPAFLSGTCEPLLYGNTPNDARFRFRNVAHVGDANSLERAHVAYLAFFRATRTLSGEPDAPYLPHCETWMRNHYGTPYFDDASLVVWKVDAK